MFLQQFVAMGWVMAMADRAVAVAVAVEDTDTTAAAHLVVEDSGPVDSTEKLPESFTQLDSSSCDSMIVSIALHLEFYSPKST